MQGRTNPQPVSFLPKSAWLGANEDAIPVFCNNPAQEPGGIMQTITADQSAPPGETLRSNEVLLTLDAIWDIRYIDGSLMVSTGQPYGILDIVRPEAPSTTWTIKLNAGRHKTSEVADAFISITGGKGRMYCPNQASDDAPDQLNFFFGVEIDILLDNKIYTTEVYLAQGSYTIIVTTNNWWIGGMTIAHQSKTAVMAVSEPSTLALKELYTLGGDVYKFTFKPWIVQDGTYTSQEDWLSRFETDPLICDINLPGTHDSTAINGLSRDPWATQDTSLVSQLKYGVRALDIRLSIYEGPAGGFIFFTCHGDFWPNDYQTLQSAMQQCSDFLGAHQKEFIAMRLRVDDWNSMPEAKRSEALLALKSMLATYPVLVNAPDMPRLSRVGGKIYLINSINDDPFLGVPIQWPNNTPNGTLRPTILRKYTVQVQDQYEDLGANPTATKLQLFKDATTRFIAGQLLINFGSATKPYLQGVYIAGDLIVWLGKSPASSRPPLKGWSFFDYIAADFPNNMYPAINMAELIISSNFGYSNYPSPFQANINYEPRT